MVHKNLVGSAKIKRRGGLGTVFLLFHVFLVERPQNSTELHRIPQTVVKHAIATQADSSRLNLTQAELSRRVTAGHGVIVTSARYVTTKERFKQRSVKHRGSVSFCPQGRIVPRAELSPGLRCPLARRHPRYRPRPRTETIQR